MKKVFKEFIPLWKFVREDRKKIIFLVILLFFASLSSLSSGYLNGLALESVVDGKLKVALIALVLYFLFNIFLNDGLDTIARKGLEKEESKISRKLSHETYSKVLNLPAVAFEEKTSGELINRITNDADCLSFVFGRLVRIASAVITALILIIYITINSYLMMIEIVVILILLGVLLKVYSPKLEEAHKNRKKKQDKQTSLITESIRGIREIRTLGIKKCLLNDSRKNIKEVYDASIIEIKLNRNFEIIGSIFRSLMEIIVFITGIIELYYGKINITFFVAMTYYVYRYTWLMEEVNDFFIEYKKLNVSLGRVNEILENRLYNDVQYGNYTLSNVSGILEFKNVKFGYPNEQIILNNFNLKLVPNKKIAIVGKSGQGKSTLFNLVTRIFDVNDGEILLDDVNIKDLTEESLNDNISIIRQEPFIFNRTIKENFTLIDNNITLKEIRKYASMSYLDDYIMSLPNKYDTILGEGGVNLSGGQKQRLAIARTLVKKSKVILLDEATSALDNNSQEFIKDTINNLVNNHTVVVVAHRLSTIIDSDIIYVVENGKIVDCGTHAYLLKHSDTYKKLYLSEKTDSKK